jgi:DnaJ family protein C protein 3
MTTKLVNDNTEAFYRISQLYYQLGEEEDSLRYNVTSCAFVV